MSARQTVEQERAREAWESVQSVLEVRDKRYQSEYLALARGAPNDIQNNGLAQTLAFWRAKGELHHQALYRHVSKRVMKELGEPEETDLLTWIMQTDSVRYRHATVVAMAFLEWIKRFAEAELQ